MHNAIPRIAGILWILDTDDVKIFYVVYACCMENVRTGLPFVFSIPYFINVDFIRVLPLCPYVRMVFFELVLELNNEWTRLRIRLGFLVVTILLDQRVKDLNNSVMSVIIGFSGQMDTPYFAYLVKLIIFLLSENQDVPVKRARLWSKTLPWTTSLVNYFEQKTSAGTALAFTSYLSVRAVTSTNVYVTSDNIASENVGTQNISNSRLLSKKHSLSLFLIYKMNLRR